MPISFDIKKGLQGIIATGIPFIFKGLINEWLTQQHIDIPKACELVLSGKDLITLFREYGADFDNVLHRAGGFVQDPSWLTSDWLIDAIRDEHPDLASLFMGWDEGRSWLDMQTKWDVYIWSFRIFLFRTYVSMRNAQLEHLQS